MRTTFQTLVGLCSREGETLEQLQIDARAAILRWLASKYPEPMPKHAWHGQSFDLELPGQQLSAIGLSDEGLWAARLVQPDTRHGERDGVPGRTWTTELGLARTSNALRFGVRVQCASVPSVANVPIVLTRPRIVIELSSNFVMFDSRRVTGAAWPLETEADLDSFHHLLLDRDRSLPVCLLTEPDHRAEELALQPFVLDDARLARDLQGMAHVVTMPARLTFSWTNKVGKPWSAFRGAVRTYLPGLDFDHDAPTEHPLALLDSILRFEDGGRKMEEGFAESLVDRTHEMVASHRVNWTACPLFLDVKRRRADLGVARANTPDQKVSALEAQLESLRQENERLEAQAESYNNDAIASDSSRKAAEVENDKLLHKIDALNAALESKTGRAVNEDVPLLDNYLDMSDWVDEYLAGRLALHARAIRALKDAQFADPSLVCRVLLLLGGEYRDMRRGVPDGKAKLSDTLNDLKLELGPAIAPSRAGEEGDEYFIRYPYADSPRRALDLHIKNRAITRDPARCLRVYFLWDDDKRQVVVGFLPGHLTIRSS